MGRRRRALPGKRRQVAASEAAILELEGSHPKLVESLLPGRMSRAERFDPAAAEARLERRAAVAAAADLLLKSNPSAALCLYAEAIWLCAKGKRTKLYETLCAKAGAARRAVQEEESQRRKARSRELRARQAERTRVRELNAAASGPLLPLNGSCEDETVVSKPDRIRGC